MKRGGSWGISAFWIPGSHHTDLSSSHHTLLKMSSLLLSQRFRQTLKVNLWTSHWMCCDFRSSEVKRSIHLYSIDLHNPSVLIHPPIVWGNSERLNAGNFIFNVIFAENGSWFFIYSLNFVNWIHKCSKYILAELHKPFVSN